MVYSSNGYQVVVKFGYTVFWTAPSKMLRLDVERTEWYLTLCMKDSRLIGAEPNGRPRAGNLQLFRDVRGGNN